MDYNALPYSSHIVDCLEFGLAMSPVEARVAVRQGDDAGADTRDFDDFDEEIGEESRMPQRQAVATAPGWRTVRVVTVTSTTRWHA